MKLITALIVIFSAFYAISSNAANDWDDVNAYRLAIASNCAYHVNEGKEEDKGKVIGCFQEKVKKVNETKKTGSNVLDIFNNLPTDAVEVFTTPGQYDKEPINAAILVKIPDGVIIAFRGTEGTPQDWLHNIFLTSIANLSERKLYDKGRHYGFNQSLSTLKKEILKDEKIWQPFFNNPSGKTLYITGHSKGGALATGATVDFAESFKDKTSKPEIVTYTFEAARFFTAMGENDNKPLLDTIWRFEYQYDIVPHVPLGKVTYDFLLQHKDEMLYKTLLNLMRTVFNLPEDWLERNNINFVSAGKLAYVGKDRKLNFDQPDSDHYKNRLSESLIEMGKNLIHIKSFVIDQHSECYLAYLKTKVTNSSLEGLPSNCRN